MQLLIYQLIFISLSIIVYHFPIIFQLTGDIQIFTHNKCLNSLYNLIITFYFSLILYYIISHMFLKLLFTIITVRSLKIQLSYAELAPSLHSQKYTIEINFNSTQTYLPIASNTIYLYNKTQLKFGWSTHEKKYIEIGLAYPSDFVNIVSKVFSVNYEKIQFGYIKNILNMLIDQVNIVQIKDVFRNNDLYKFNILYNYGDVINIKNQKCQIIEGNIIYFNEFFILEVLNRMSAENQITYERSKTENKIILTGKIQNFPRIIAADGIGEFKINIIQKEIYINQNPITLIGIKALYQYDKFQFLSNGINLKKSTNNYVLYGFFGVYGVFVLILTYGCRTQSIYTMGFMRNLFKYSILKDPRARIQILSTQLQ